MVQETVYQAIERDVENVSLFWKAVHILLYTITTISSFTAALSYQQLLSTLGDNCPLYPALVWENDSSVYYEPVGAFPNTSASFHNAFTDWGASSLCAYCLQALMYGGIVAVICMAFCVICSRGGAGYKDDLMQRPYQLVIPLTIITLIATICEAIMYFQLIGGLGQFCAQFYEETNSDRCDEQLNIYTLLFHKEKMDSYLYLTLTKYTALIVFISWLLQLTLFVGRIISAPDFKIIKTNVLEPHKERRPSRSSYDAETET